MTLPSKPHCSTSIPESVGEARRRHRCLYLSFSNYVLYLDAFALLGGGIAITLYNLAPDKIKSLVLVDSTGIPSKSIPEMIPRRAIEMTAQISIPKLKLQLVDIPKVFTYNLLFNTGNVIHALLLSLYRDISHLLPNIQAPCMLLWSEKDLTTPLNNAQKMAAMIPNSKLVTVEEGWHEWGLWYPEKFTSLILDFVKQVELYSREQVIGDR
jgi:pimeloyl-ACP methyl ester carboxylesterase